ncbi:MAG: 3-oxoacyl-[acyl-carrier-protein] reductase [Verrucomicrobiota bacterium]
MQKLLENKVAVVTGAGRGIGKAIALRLAGAGASVACCGRTLAHVEATVKEIAGKAVAYAVDVVDSQQVSATCEQILKDFGRVDILVNNAGVTRDGLLMRMSEADWDTVMDTNLKGAFHFTKAFTRSFLKQRSGRIINISSISGLTGNAGQSNYAASKAGLIGFTKSMARELASRGITANAVAPGFIETDMTAVLDAATQAAVKEKIALGRFGRPDDIANAVLYLASDMGDYVTGQVISVDGGMAM